MKQYHPSVIVIGRYHPRTTSAQKMGHVLTTYVRKLGLKPHPAVVTLIDHVVEDIDLVSGEWNNFPLSAEVRTPYVHNLWTKKKRTNNDISLFHHDGFSKSRDLALVLWATHEPTEIELPDNTIVQPRPYEIVLLSNSAVRHRSPILTEPGKRYFFRQVVQAPTWLKY